MKKYASVIVEISATSLDRPFTYCIPDCLLNEIEIGSIVNIPFGRLNQERTGYVVELLEEINFDPNKLKEILSLNTQVNVESDLIRLANWLQKRTLCTLQTALKSMIPTTEEVNKKTAKYLHRNIDLEPLKEIISQYENKKIYQSRIKGLSPFLDYEIILEQDLIQQYQVSKGIIKTLIEKGFLIVQHTEIYRNPYDLEKINSTQKLIPNDLQKEAINQILTDVLLEKSSVFLLHGITGSGKTEVYMQVIEEVIHQKKQAIVLIPEIALTPQTVSRFIGRFGDRVGVLHSKLSKGERYDQWRKAKEGKIDIMIGPRSAIFAPFANIGIIILDEEHEATYKSEMPPKYHAREVAIKRGSMSHCPVLLGSATPLVETYYKALQGKYKLLKLTEKAISQANLTVSFVDMRSELTIGNKSILSDELKSAIEEALERKEQIILFLNRRGFSTFVSCRSCGYVVKCQSCDIPFTYHLAGEKLVCHYCNKTIKKLQKCPVCGSLYIKEFGIGTQKVENYIKSVFQEAKVLRMDMDTTSTKKGHEDILEQFEQGNADILIGTQMVAKGHHFENVTVVGVLAADLSLFVNDFRASERTFQLITQVTGRTGRGLKKGRAIIQTYSPEHYSLIYACAQDYEGFYQDEIAYRKMMSYPPFSQMAIILLSSTDELDLIEVAHHLKDYIAKDLVPEIAVLGPSPANISKIKNNFRWRIILKSEDYKLLSKKAVEINDQAYNHPRYQNTNIQIDINPMMSY